MRRTLLLLLAAVMTVGVLAPTAAAVDPDPQVTAVTPGTILPADDFSSRFRGHFWDFSSEDHLGWETSQSLWTNPQIAGGWFSGTTQPLSAGASNTNAAIRVNNFTEPGTIPVPEEFAGIPFDPTYRYVNVRMCVTFNNRSVLSGYEPDPYTWTTISWHRDSQLSALEWGVTHGIRVYEGCGFYTFDLLGGQNTAAQGKLSWGAGGFTGLRFRPATHADVTVEVDYMTLSPGRTGAEVGVWWNDNGEPVDLLMDTSDTLDRATPVRLGMTGGKRVWRTPNLPPGTYYLALEQDGTVFPGGMLTVNGPPRGEFLTPSFTSGPSYTDVGRGGNPWDMSGADDVELTNNVNEVWFAGGNMHGANTTSDPGVRLDVNRDIPIDPTRFYYLTYRMWLQDTTEPTPGFGSVVRAHWWTGEKFSDKFSSTTEDTRDYDGWQEITIDLRGDVLEPEATNLGGAWGAAGPVYWLRIDPNESNTRVPFLIDWVKLTGNHRVDKALTVVYETSDPENDPVTTEFFHDTDQDHTNGATAFVCTPLATPGTCEFATAALPEDDYYLHMKLSDPAGNVFWVTSDVPVEVRRAPLPMSVIPASTEVDLWLDLTFDPGGHDVSGQSMLYFMGSTPKKKDDKEWVACSPLAETPQTCRVDVSRVPEGTYYVYLRLKDPITGEQTWVENQIPIEVRHVIQQPSLTASPDPADWEVFLTFDPAGIDLTNVRAHFFYGTTPYRPKYPTYFKVRPTLADPLTFYWDTGYVPDGSYYVYIRLKDITTGQQQWVITDQPVQIQHIAATMTLTPETLTADDSVRLIFDRAGNWVGRYKRQYFYGTTPENSRDRAWFDCPRIPEDRNICTFDTSGVPEGSYYVYLRLKDPDGNQRWINTQDPIVVEH